MRLTPAQEHTLKAAVRRRFGAGARLWVFGSRVDDAARGGDFDLLVRCDEADAARLIDARLSLLADLHASVAFEDERIDIVLRAPALEPQPGDIHRHAITQGVELPL